MSSMMPQLTMIIIFHQKNDLKDLQKVAKNIAHSEHKPVISQQLVVAEKAEITYANEIASLKNQEIELYLLGHSQASVDKLAGLTAQNLAEYTKNLINHLNAGANTLKSIHVSSCNLGVAWEGKEAFVNRFAFELSARVENYGGIPVTAPNGMLVYDNLGIPHVIQDNNPLGETDKNTEALLENTRSNHPELLETILAPKPFQTAYTIDLKKGLHLIKGGCFFIDEDMNFGGSIKDERIRLNSETYNAITSEWAFKIGME